MDAPLRDRVRRIFEEAIGRPPAERRSWIDDACGGDSALRDEVEALVAAHECADRSIADSTVGLLGRAFPGIADPLDALGIVPGSQVGRYRILQMLGEGGFGVVYLAEQKEPVRRQVALKVIKFGMDTREVVTRFEAERQALALMDHPGIAKVLDAGATDAGRPYFVMELVRGVPITDYADASRLDTRARLELFADVCAAVHHAHQKGIIHRDIKPSNILVTIQDGVAVPKVIDFGIAKALNARLTDKTLFTSRHEFVGTPAYVSPEQAEMSGLDVDTRSDVYSLGVLLYELLTGTTPLDAKQVLSAGFEEMLKMIRELDPPRPSTRLGAMDGETRSALARRRKTDPAGLGKAIRGDVDWIAMRALEKDRTRRYGSAMDLARDIRRHLAREPVEARPPSRLYRIQRLLQRNRLAVSAAAVVALSLVAGLAASTWMYVRERDARGRAVAAGREATDEADVRQGIVEFLRQDILQQADVRMQAGAGYAPDPNLTVREALRRASSRIGDRFREKPLVEAGILRTIGNSLAAIGDLSEAIPQLERSSALYLRERGAASTEALALQVDLGQLYHVAGRIPEAVDLQRRILPALEAALGAGDRKTLFLMGNLGVSLRQAGNLPEARAVLDEALGRAREHLGPADPDTLRIQTHLAGVLSLLGKEKEALALAEEAVTVSRASFGPESLQAVAIVQETLRHLRETPAPGAEGLADELAALLDLAQVSRDAGRAAEADAFQSEALGLLRKGAGPESAAVQHLRVRMGDRLLLDGKSAESEALLRPAIAALEKAPDGGPAVHHARSVLGGALAAQARPEEAERYLVDGYVGLKECALKMPRAAAPVLRGAAERLIAFRESRGDAAEAARLRAELGAHGAGPNGPPDSEPQSPEAPPRPGASDAPAR